MKKILLLYRTFGPSVNLCGYIQLKLLAEHGQVEFRHRRIMDVTKADLEWCEIAMFVRGDGLLDEWLARVCHQAGKTVVYALDDDLLHVPENLGSGPYYAQESVKKHIRSMMEYSDYFCSPSKVLLRKYGGQFRQCFLMHEPSAYVLAEKPENRDGVVHIGFAGSSDRGQDVDTILADALEEVSRTYGDSISIEIFGTDTEIAGRLHCKTIPYTESYETYQAKMKELNWDIGLAPMPETEFHACKYYNKLVEYAGYGIVGIYSNVLPYTEAAEDRVNGLVCENRKEDWIQALSELIEDSVLRKKLSSNCLHQAQTIFSVRFAAEDFLRCLDAMEVKIQGTKVRFHRWMKVVGLCSWYAEKVKKFGWKTPVVAVRKAVRLMRRK